MDLNMMYSGKRTGTSGGKDYARSIYRRDYDRIIFSSAFRRLQNKTQVFPLPGSVFVHNRLTHSLEVSSVGRSLGAIAGEHFASKYAGELTPMSMDFYLHDLQDVVAAACLCHDIGNPAFGHSGEDAISEYFREKQCCESFKGYFTDVQWADLVNFEGNANAIRCLTSMQSGKESGGLGLTCSTLAAIVKYPCSSSAIDSSNIHRKKFGYLQADREVFLEIVEETSMLRDETVSLPGADAWLRHPFVWLVEAADDICYNIIDLEDAHRLRIIDYQECRDVFLKLLRELNDDVDETNKINDRLLRMNDRNSQISYLRAKTIGFLIYRVGELFVKNDEKILDGSLNRSLYDSINDVCSNLTYIADFSRENIYNHRSVVEIENAGYNVIKELLRHFVDPVLKSERERSKAEKKAVKLIPPQFLFTTDDPYLRTLGVIDYVAGMTDNYAVDLYKRIKGIAI